MGAKTLTRADIADAVVRKAGISRQESQHFVEVVLNEITNSLEGGDNVKLSSFGSFGLREKGERIGRNPKTGEEVPITPRRVLFFKPSNLVKNRINDKMRMKMNKLTERRPGQERTAGANGSKAPNIHSLNGNSNSF